VQVLVLGGYGNFGARICRALARRNIEVIAVGRDPDRGHRVAGFDARVGKARIDVSDSDLTKALRDLSPHTVIHCVGPFQGQDYRVAAASLAAGAHYIDLADGRSFVANFAREIGPLAHSAGRLAVSGASTLPALSSAVVDALKDRFSSLDEIQVCIAPAQRAPRGAATLKAVFSYLGKPFNWWTDGSWRPAYGWQELRRMQLGELGTRWAAACDVPDLELFPARYPDVKTVQFRAALELGAQHFLLAAAAQMKRWRLPIPLERWAAPLDRVACWLDGFGSERGGMRVSVSGTRKNGGKARIDWHLIADNNHGPEIPCMAAILLAQKLLREETALRGAMPCMGLLTLDEFAPEFSRWGIRTNLTETAL
jgi:NAD(P)-dependent dehydrogenase (short-subunit alcohol dehydrogenase family)